MFLVIDKKLITHLYRSTQLMQGSTVRMMFGTSARLAPLSIFTMAQVGEGGGPHAEALEIFRPVGLYVINNLAAGLFHAAEEFPVRGARHLYRDLPRGHLPRRLAYEVDRLEYLAHADAAAGVAVA